MHGDDERGPGGPAGPGGRLSRRQVLQGMVALAALAGCSDGGTAAGGPAARGPAPLPARPPSADGLRAFVLGMHLHASASEGQGSMHAQLVQAAANGFDVAWFTEHDWRRRRLLFRPSYSFVPGESQLGGVWNLDRLPDEGRPTAGSGGAQVTSPVTPADPSPRKASLRLRVTSAGSDPATVGYRVHAEGTSRANFRARLAGRTLAVDVLPVTSGPDAWAEVQLALSYHPGAGSRPAGVCSLRYRLFPGAVPAAHAEGTTAVVDVPVAPGRWQTVTLDAVGDLHRVWPDMDPRDHSLHDIAFRATSQKGAPGDVCFGYLRLTEQAGYDAVGVEQDLVARYAGVVPDVLGLIGTEISLGPHLNQFGGVQAPFDYGPLHSLKDVPGGELIPPVIRFVHAHGGLVSINHPAPRNHTPGLTDAQRIALDLLTLGGGADLLEVGYGKAGLDVLPEHLASWDVLARNGRFVTGNGVSDDHSGQNWAEQGARFYTGAWSPRLDQAALLDTLGRGRAYAGYLGAFGGTIDMSLDGGVPMGAVSVSPRTSRTVRIDVTGLPDGGAVQVVQGPVDRPGTADLSPGTRVARTLGAADLRRSTEVPVDTADDCFVRLQVVDRAGAVVAFGQPVWALKAVPEGGIPANRRAAG